MSIKYHKTPATKLQITSNLPTNFFHGTGKNSTLSSHLKNKAIKIYFLRRKITTRKKSSIKNYLQKPAKGSKVYPSLTIGTNLFL